jgi:hypothetical protein
VTFQHRLSHALRESGPAPDSIAALRLIYGGGWRKVLLLRFLRVRFSPDVLKRVRGLPLPLEERARLFSQAMSLINVNETYKTTGSDRTRLTDMAIVRIAAGLRPLRLLDIGVSDGSASVALLSRLPGLVEAILTDLHPHLYARGPRFLRIFLDGRRRLLGVKVMGLYINLATNTVCDGNGFETIGTLNPAVQERHGILAIRPFDAFSDRLPEPVQFIKCSNMLNFEYFCTDDIRLAVANLGRSLTDGGYLFLSQNNARYAEGEAYFVLQKRGGSLALVEERGGHEAVGLFAEPLEMD